MRKDKRPGWILPFTMRSKVSNKYKETEKQMKRCKTLGDRNCVKRLKYLLRHAWWGIKRYR